jgi:Uma2 family endonuclease
MATDLIAQHEEAELEEDLATFEHGMIVTNLISYLAPYVKAKKLGRVVDSSPEYRFLAKKGKPGEKAGRFPDVSFVKQSRLPKNVRSYPTIAPDLAIEVSSPTDKEYDIETKVKEYQQAEVSLIWVIHPVSRSVDVYRLSAGMRKQNYIVGDKLSGEMVLPGFKLAVGDIFDYPSPAEIEDESNEDQ